MSGPVRFIGGPGELVEVSTSHEFDNARGPSLAGKVARAGTPGGSGGTRSRASPAAASVTRLAAAAAAVSPAAWARNGPAAAPASVAAASPVRKTAPIRPRTVAGTTRCMAVCGITSDMEPNMPTAAAAGSAVRSEDEVNRPI
jgi:hypothetical protein